MTYQESLDFLYRLQMFGIKLGLENIRTFLSRLGHPESRFKTILVAGTNGKGSTAAALAAILNGSGYRTGLYTSPHLHSFCERVQVDGSTIAEEDVVGLVAEMREKVGDLPLTFFEFTTALALQFFAEQEVDLAVVEVGLGGRLDATNAVKPILSVITPVAVDHEQYLGESLAQIACEKAGIMRTGVPVVIAGQQDEAKRALQGEAKKVGAPLIAFHDDYNVDGYDETFDYRGLSRTLNGLRPGIPGRHQFGNMATALAAAEVLQQLGIDTTDRTMRSGIEQVSWPGRLEWLADGTVLLDGAHNGAGAVALARYLCDREMDKVHWVVGMKADKDFEEILAPLASRAAALYCVAPPVEEAVPVASLCSAAEALGLSAMACSSPEEALQKARAVAGDSGVVLVAGSLFLVAAIREILLREEGRWCDKSGL